MTMDRLCYIAEHIRSFDLSKYQGIIILHGTDSLAYTASFLSFVFADVKVPVILVSGHKPPNEEGTNANENFGVAVKLITSGIAPNVYAVYQNTDGKMWVHLGATLMQCPNFSDDFENASVNKKMLVGSEDLLEKCKFYSERRTKTGFKFENDKKVLNIMPYTGLCYENISLENVCAVVHGTYHSGTVCVGRNDDEKLYGNDSVLWFADKCRQKNIPVFIAPSKLSKKQYSSVFDAVENGGLIPLYMTRESAYCKASLGEMNGLSGDKLMEFMMCEINNEFI
jgi:L-asparaginase